MRLKTLVCAVLRLPEMWNYNKFPIDDCKNPRLSRETFLYFDHLILLCIFSQAEDLTTNERFQCELISRITKDRFTFTLRVIAAGDKLCSN